VSQADWDNGKALKRSQDQPAKYAPHIDRNRQEALEMHCIDEGMVIKERADIARFYFDAGEIIGVCSGEETRYVYAEWTGPPNGEVHGRPVSVKQLRIWGVVIHA